MNDEEDTVDGIARETARDWEYGSTSKDEGIAVLSSTIFSIFVAIIGYEVTCAAQYACRNDGTCIADNKTCSFTNIVTPAGWRLSNVSDTRSSLHGIQRGVCSPGERQNLDPFHDRVECVRHRLYPSALDMEIRGEEGEGDYHRQWCGAWIDAGKSNAKDESFSFYDEENVKEDVEDAIQARGSARIASSDIGKFRSTCVQMLLTNAVAPAGSLAYEFLKSGTRTSFETEDDVLRGIGFLNSLFCDSPSSVAVSFDDKRFIVNVSSGTLVFGEALYEAMYSVGASREERDNAKLFAKELSKARAHSEVSETQATRILEGSFEDTWVQGLVGPGLYLYRGDDLHLVSRYLQTAHDLGFDKARHYVLGLAAHCAFATRWAVTGDFGANGHLRKELDRLRASRPPASALGRLKSDTHSRLGLANASLMSAANSITWSSLTSSLKIWTSTRDTARQRCARAAAAAFPDTLDEREFNLLVTPLLYSRLEGMAATLRTATAAAFSTPPYSSILTDAGRVEAVAKVQQSFVRIPGAPRRSWAGLPTVYQRPSLTSEDGALVILLKQAKAIFLDRMRLAVEQRNVCEHPPLFGSMERNAYMLTMHPCIVLLPGILVPPFAGERYSDESLFSKIGWVVSHEFAHATSNFDYWNMESANQLLAGYARSNYYEAAADIGAVVAIMGLGIVSNESLCGHLSQTWCARSNLLRELLRGHLEHIHPPPNIRGDMMCKFIKKHYS